MPPSIHQFMQQATNRFFDVPELVNLLLQFIDLKDISRLMQTCRNLNELCAPTFYYDVMAAYQFDRGEIFIFKDCVKALARNTHHVRQLTLQIPEVAYYANCAMAYHDKVLCRATTDTTNKDNALQQQFFQAQRPLWLAPPDPHNCDVLPMPPMKLLTKLKIHAEFFSAVKNKFPNPLPSSKDPKATLTHLCWIMDLNPNLLDVSLNAIIIKDQRDIRLLTTSISGLKSLQKLRLETHHDYARKMPSDLASMFFFSFPASLQSLDLCLVEVNSLWEAVSDDYLSIAHGWLQMWEEWDISVKIPRRQEPLLYLVSLNISDSRSSRMSENGVVSILAHCSNIASIGLSLMMEIHNVDHFAEEIAQLCPNLISVRTVDAYGNKAQMLAVRLLRLLPEQQVKMFNCESYRQIEDLNLADSRWHFRRHSRTLQSIDLCGCRNFDSRTIQVILGQCGALEKFFISWQNINTRQQILIDLGHAIEFPWGCTRIKWLGLNVTIPDKPLHLLTKGRSPYYSRPAPIALSTAERDQFKSLEAFYRQIGALTELQNLTLRVIFHDPQGRRPATGNYSLNTFPGMLSLGCEETGRPGFLHHLAGLTKLKTLRGSVSTKVAENKATIGTREIEWMKQHWPVLEDFSVLREWNAMPKRNRSVK